MTGIRYFGERQRIVFVNLLGESVEVLAGANGAPTITAGYAKWLNIPRPQRNAVTVLEGYEPTTLSIPVTFSAIMFSANPAPGSWVRVGSPQNVETAITTLEEMAGLRQKRQGTKEYRAETQLLNVYTADGKGNQIPLLPPGARTIVEKANTYWVIDGIEWDTKPEREGAGNRIRQDATVTLLEWSAPPGAREPVDVLREALARSKPVVFTTTAAINTVKRIAAHYHRPYQQAWQEILAANRGNKTIGTSPSKHLPVGTKVRVPATIAESGLR